MTPRTLLLLTCTSALAGMVLLHLHLNQIERDAAGGEKVPILTAVDDIPAGTALQRTQLAVRQIPIAYVSSRQVTAADAEQILGVRLSIGLKANDYLEWTDLTQGQTTGRDLSSLIQEGMRALSLKGDNLFEGLLRPGDRVDVLFSTHDGNDSTTSTLLQNIMILAVGGRIDQHASDHGSAASVTLSATVEQSQTITEALQHGTIALVLRNPNDIVIAESPSTAAARDILSAPKSSALAAAAKSTNNKPQELTHAR